MTKHQNVQYLRRILTTIIHSRYIFVNTISNWGGPFHLFYFDKLKINVSIHWVFKIFPFWNSRKIHTEVALEKKGSIVMSCYFAFTFWPKNYRIGTNFVHTVCHHPSSRLLGGMEKWSHTEHVRQLNNIEDNEDINMIEIKRKRDTVRVGRMIGGQKKENWK